MVEKGKPVSAGENGMGGSRGGSVKGILFFLFALAVCFGYFYFFTDVLRPREETPGQPDVYTSELKQPLPERLVQSSATSAEEAITSPPGSPALPEDLTSGAAATASRVSPGEVPSEQKKLKALPGGDAPSTAPQPTAQRSAAAAKKSVKVVAVPGARKSGAVTPRSEPSVSRTPAVKQEQSVAKTSRPPAPVKPTASRISAPGGQTAKVVAGQKPAVEKIAKTPIKTATPLKKATSGQPAAKKQSDEFALVVGSYVLKSSLRADKAKLEKAGLQTFIVPGKMRSQPMNRLLVAEVASHEAALAELVKVKKASKDAFFLQENNKYAIYAGSYFADDRAVQEQERLRKLGFVPILKRSQAPVPSYSLTAGSFPTREAALKEAERLKKIGFTPYPVLQTK
ncbi:MAG: SPOR domain-containing protein [Deltaproteobacteria bacterium]|nr:SPOR domain-containing protein [Deltaproteobacteria bacterium]